jgi:hypothetical protein
MKYRPPEIRMSPLGENERQFIAVDWLRNCLTSVKVGVPCPVILSCANMRNLKEAAEYDVRV